MNIIEKSEGARNMFSGLRRISSVQPGGPFIVWSEKRWRKTFRESESTQTKARSAKTARSFISESRRISRRLSGRIRYGRDRRTTRTQTLSSVRRRGDRSFQSRSGRETIQMAGRLYRLRNPDDESRVRIFRRSDVERFSDLRLAVFTSPGRNP